MLSESKQLVMENSREAIFTKNLTKQNGKEKCFICLRDTNPPEEKLIEESDCLSLYYNKKTNYMLFNPNSKQANGDKLSNLSNQYNQLESAPNQNLIIPIQLNTKHVQSLYLFSPCKCDKLAHMICFTNYCIMNISFKCNKCSVNYSVEFTEIKSNTNIFLGIFLLMFFVLFHVGIFLILFLLFFGYFKFPKPLEGMQDVIGCACFIINIFLIYFSYNLVRKILRRKYLKPKFSNNTELKKGKTKIDHKLGSDFNNFMMRSHKCSQLDLIEKKINNNIFLETIIKDNMKLSEFIKDNNNFYNIKRYGSSDNINEEVNSMNKFNKTNVFSKINSMKSLRYSQHGDIHRQKSSELRPKLSEKIVNYNFNLEKETNLVIKSKTKSSCRLREENLIWDIDKIEEVEEYSQIKLNKLQILSEEQKIIEIELLEEKHINHFEDEKKIENVNSFYSPNSNNEEKNNFFPNVNVTKNRSHKKKLSINNNLRMMDTKGASVENMLKKKMNENQNKLHMSVDPQINDDAANSATFLNADDLV